MPAGFLGTDFYFQIDSVTWGGSFFQVEHKENEVVKFQDICSKTKYLDDLYIWINFWQVNYFEGTIFIDYSIFNQSVQDEVINIISTLFPINDCKECLTFKSTDISELILL